MTVIVGTVVIDTVVPTDSADEYGTHDDQYGIGGFRPAETIAIMEAITAGRRKKGMEVRVTNDPTPELNGRYVLQDDLTTWILEEIVLGDPPDAGWGTGASNVHALTGVATGDSSEESMDKILTHLENTAPALPPLIDSLTLDMPNLYPANKQGEASHVLKNNIQTLVDPIGTLSGKFGNATAGIVLAKINTVTSGSRTLTDLPAGSDNSTTQALSLTNEEVFNVIYQQIDAAIQTEFGLTLNNVEHEYKILHGILFANILFYVDDPIQPNIISMALIGNHVAATTYISGVPTLDVGDSLLSTFTITNSVSWFYNLIKFGKVESDYTDETDVPLVTGKNNGDNVVATSLVTTVLNNVYTENADITAYGYNSRFGTTEEIPTDTGSSSTTGTSGNIRIDTISDETIRVTSGAGQFPVVGGGAAGQPFVSTQQLISVGNEELQLINGRFIYPITDFSGNNPTAGPDYSSVPSGGYNGIRWATFDLGGIVAQTDFEFDLSGLMGFNGNPVESGDYALYVTVDGATGWLDANVAYPGSGEPFNSGDPALDLGSSSITHKRVTFGTTPRTGNVYVRIGWASTQTREITLIE